MPQSWLFLPCPVFSLAPRQILRRQFPLRRSPTQRRIFLDRGLPRNLRCLPTAKRCHFFPPAGPSPLKLHTLEQKCQSRLAPLRFRCSPSLPKSPSSIQLFGSTKVTHTGFATQSYLSFTAPTHHVTCRRRKTPLIISTQCGNLYSAVARRQYTSPITQSRFLDLKSFEPT